LSLNELRSKLRPTKDPIITFPAEGSEVNEGEAVIGITDSHQNKAKKTFIIEKGAGALTRTCLPSIAPIQLG
jgi:hypothetical protein